MEKNGQEVRVTPRSMDVLVYLAERAGQVVAGQELLDAFWTNSFATDQAIHKAVAELRRAFGDNARSPTYIKTVPRRGYCLIADVKRTTEASRDTSTKCIAVLPFKNIDRSLENQSLVDGIAEALLDGLAKLPNLNVASRIDSFNHTADGETTAEIGAALGVDHLLEGSIQRSNGRMRITVQLIRVSDGFHLYSDYVDVEPDDALEAQDTVASSVTAALKVHLDDSARTCMLESGTGNALAYLALTEADFRRAQNSTPDLEHAIELYRSASDLDANFVEAYVGEAQAITNLCYYMKTERIIELRERLGELRREVERLRPDSEALASIKDMQLRTNGADLMQLEAQRRTQALSGDCDALVSYAGLLMGARLYEEGVALLDLIPDNAETLDRRIQAYDAHRSIEMRKPLLAEKPDHIGWLMGQVASLAFVGRYEEAEECLRHIEKREPGSPWFISAKTFLALIRGDLPLGSDALEAVLAQSTENRFRGSLCFAVGDVERGLEYWRRISVPMLRTAALHLHVNERLFPPELFRDPRYHEVLEGLGIGKTWQRRLMEGVIELEPATGVKLSDRAREHYEADAFMIPGEPLRD